MKITVCNEELELLPEKALYWPRKKLLALSDIHLGKAESYQAAGVPVPSGPHLEDLFNLQNLLQIRDVKKVFILGDLIHNRHSWTAEVRQDFFNLLESFQEISWALIFGNHEKGSLKPLQELPFHFFEEQLIEEPFLFSHGHDEDQKNSTHFQIQGHIHPQVFIKEAGLSLRLPCFHLQENSLTLPAFGTLTGGYIVSPHKKDRLFAVASPEVFEMRR